MNNSDMETILWQLLADCGCSIEKYLQKEKYKSAESGDEVDYYLTRVMTMKAKRGIIITKVIEGNWYDTVKNIDNVILNVEKNIHKDMNNHIIIFHGYFESIKLEQFYIINPGSENMLTKLPLMALEKLLR